MIFKKKSRKFKPSKYSGVVLKDCGKIILNDNEQVTFSDKYKKNNDYDVTKKDWGYYATPSINSRLKKNNYLSYIVVNKSTKFFYIMLVHKKKRNIFLKYLKKENLKIISWPKNLSI
jgi:hypothetical protein